MTEVALTFLQRCEQAMKAAARNTIASTDLAKAPRCTEFGGILPAGPVLGYVERPMRRSPVLFALLLGALSCRHEPSPPPRARPDAPIAGQGATPASAPLTIGTTNSALSPSDHGSGKVEHYAIFIGRMTAEDGKPRIVLRTFDRGGVAHALVVSPETLKTEVVKRDGARLEPISWDTVGADVAGSAYLRALQDVKQHASVLQDAGVTHVLPAEHGVVLTVDLCPSRKPLDAVLFDRVLATFTPEEHPVPVALAITGVWMKQHPKELTHLIELQKAGRLDITWINHSYNHRYDPKLPLPQNFLLEKGTSIEDEVLKTEIALIDRGVTPSVLFRFPGLISDAEIVRTVVGYGLVPVGSDAWLAKKERAHSGDIVLVHGNGNEPQGISAFFALLGQEKKDIERRQFLLLDIREGIEEEESK